jgi:uncharacterized Fe-S cluster protein YjdI
MSDSPTRKRYRGTALDVSYDIARCRHVAECLRGLPAVFDFDRRPWILPDAADPDDVVRVVARCPTGALRTHPTTSTSETPVTPTEVTMVPGGPLLLRGDLHITAPGVDEHELRAALARAGTPRTCPIATAAGRARTGRTAKRVSSRLALHRSGRRHAHEVLPGEREGAFVAVAPVGRCRPVADDSMLGDG